MVHLKATQTEVQTDVDTSAEEFLIDWQEAMEPPEFQWARRRTRHEADLMAAQAVEARLASFNVGFMFLKPHANTEASRDFVRKQLRKAGIDVLREGSIDAESISSGRLIDRHYGSMAAKAVDTDPAELVVPEAAQVQFADCFGLTWREALDRGLVCNALDATQRLKCTEHDLDDKWTPLQLGEGKVKLGGGCYCGKIDGIFVINAFYMAMRQAYVEEGKSVHWFSLEWDAWSLKWEDFRTRILGHTEPSRAEEGSLRGDAFRRWRELGLDKEPDVGENFVHGSASPLEAFAERANWLGESARHDRFAKLLLARGIPEDVLDDWTKDPSVHHDGRRHSLFDLFENRDTMECLDLASALAADR